MKLVFGAALLLLMPVTALAQSPEIRVLGEVRVRGEGDRPAAIDSLDVFTALRVRLGVEAALAPRALVFVQVQDARTFGEEVSTTDGSADRIDIHQAWLQYGRAAGHNAWSARAGRQEVSLGNERLLGAAAWTATGRAFDGARASFGAGDGSWRLSALGAVVQERGRRALDPEPLDRDDHLLLGAFVEAAQGELYALHDRAAAFRLWTGVDRTTVGARAVVPPYAGLTASLEGAYQFGNQVGLFDDIIMAQDIGAWMLGARLGWNLPTRVLPRLGIGIDVLSGDETVTDDTYGAFNTLYATNHKFYGYIDFFLDPATRTRDAGLVDGMASATIALAQDVRLELDAHGFWLQQDVPWTDDSLIGWEIDTTLPIRLGDGQQLQLGYSAFRGGPAAGFIGLGGEREWSHWAYLQATFSFGGAAPPIL